MDTQDHIIHRACIHFISYRQFRSRGNTRTLLELNLCRLCIKLGRRLLYPLYSGLSGWVRPFSLEVWTPYVRSNFVWTKFAAPIRTQLPTYFRRRSFLRSCWFRRRSEASRSPRWWGGFPDVGPRSRRSGCPSSGRRGWCRRSPTSRSSSPLSETGFTGTVLVNLDFVLARQWVLN